MSTFSYHLGFALGTVTREFLREVKKPSGTRPAWPVTENALLWPGPCLPAQVVDELSHVPAIVRAKGVNLYEWYETNTRVIAKPPRKRRQRKPLAENLENTPTDPALGPLADLI